MIESIIPRRETDVYHTFQFALETILWYTGEKKGMISMTETKHSLIASFRCAFQGIAACIRRERNMKIHICAAAVVTAAGFVFRISSTEWLVCLLLFAMVMGAELINTALEAAVDLACPKQHPTAKLAKDAAAGAVLIIAIFAAIAGLVIFLPKLISFFR